VLATRDILVLVEDFLTALRMSEEVSTRALTGIPQAHETHPFNTLELYKTFVRFSKILAHYQVISVYIYIIYVT
jgi:hypothetical protein